MWRQQVRGGSLHFSSVQSCVQQGAVSARRLRFLHLNDRPLQVGLLDRTNEVVRRTEKETGGGRGR